MDVDVDTPEPLVPVTVTVPELEPTAHPAATTTGASTVADEERGKEPSGEQQEGAEAGEAAGEAEEEEGDSEWDAEKDPSHDASDWEWKSSWNYARDWALRDTRTYREGYPGKGDDPTLNDNLLFYSNELRCRPDRKLIDEVHAEWRGAYDTLEWNHGYIQWLFPIRERGVNWAAQELQPHEADAIRASPDLVERVFRSYELMLDFYGMRLVDRETGEVQRSANWERRYANLDGNSHNYLRITRILKFLGEVGLERLKKPFVLFVLSEVLVHKELIDTRSSCENYWAGVLRSDAERQEVYDWIAAHDPAAAK